MPSGLEFNGMEWEPGIRPVSASSEGSRTSGFLPPRGIRVRVEGRKGGGKMEDGGRGREGGERVGSAEMESDCRRRVKEVRSGGRSREGE